MTVCPNCACPQFFPRLLNVPEFVECINRGFQGPQWSGGNDGGGYGYFGKYSKFESVPACTSIYSTNGNLKTVELRFDQQPDARREFSELSGSVSEAKIQGRPPTELDRSRVARMVGTLTESVGPCALGRFRELTNFDVEETLILGTTILH